MKTKLGAFGRVLLIGLAGTALVATTVATSNVSACTNERMLDDDYTCSIAGSGLTIAIGHIRIVVR
jgi:hypothetical protein